MCNSYFKIKTYCFFVLAICLVLSAQPAHAQTINVLLLSNHAWVAENTKSDFLNHMSGFNFDTRGVNTEGIPTLEQLQQYDVVLLWEDGQFAGAQQTGNVVEQYVQEGGRLVIGTFYWQDRSDNSIYNPPGWGSLENIDPFTCSSVGTPGCEYEWDSLDADSLVDHPLTAGVTSMTGYHHGGVAAKPGTTVLAKWSDGIPLIGFSNDYSIVAISHNPDHNTWGSGEEATGDFYQMWENALNWVVGVMTVEIDIMPGSYPNAINLGSKGVIPIAIFSSSELDATTVDPDSVELGGAGVAVRGKGDKYMAHEEDINGDGLTDLLVQVETENLDPETFQYGFADLTGQTYNGVFIKGEDEIIIVPPE